MRPINMGSFSTLTKLVLLTFAAAVVEPFSTQPLPHQETFLKSTPIENEENSAIYIARPSLFSRRFHSPHIHTRREPSDVERLRALHAYSTAALNTDLPTITEQMLCRGGTREVPKISKERILKVVASTTILMGLLSGRITRTLGSVKFWSTLAPFASIALKLSPLPNVLRIAREQDTRGLPLLPYSAMYLVSLNMIIYGLLVRDPRIFGAHSAGHLLSIGYCITFIKNYRPMKNSGMETKVGRHVVCAGAVALGLMTSVACLGQSALAVQVAGNTSVLLSCLMYSGPLVAFRRAVQTKSARNIPLAYDIASMVNAVAWIVYGFGGRSDWRVWAPSVVGLFSSSLQVGVHAAFGA